LKSSAYKLKTAVKTATLLIISLTFLLMLPSCNAEPVTAGSDSTSDVLTPSLRIVTSIIPTGEFIKKIGSERVEVTVMVPEGADPHIYEPSPGQLKALSGAQMYAKLGSGLEFEIAWMDKLISVNPGIFVLDLSKGIDPIYDSEEKSIRENNPAGNENKQPVDQAEKDSQNNFKKGADPHIWLSIKNTEIIAENIFHALAETDSEGESYYSSNLASFIKELEALDSKIKSGLAGKINKKFIVYHPAWEYFAKDYGLTQITVEVQGKEPTGKEISSVISFAIENNIKVIFASPQFNPKSAEVIAKEIGGVVVFIDPLAPDYMKNMEIILESFQQYLQ